MAISKEQLAKIIGGRAKDLCNSEFDRMVESRTSFGKQRGNSSDYYGDEYMEESYDDDTSYDDYDDSDIEYNHKTASKSKMPEYIK